MRKLVGLGRLHLLTDWHQQSVKHKTCSICYNTIFPNFSNSIPNIDWYIRTVTDCKAFRDCHQLSTIGRHFKYVINQIFRWLSNMAITWWKLALTIEFKQNIRRLSQINIEVSVKKKEFSFFETFASTFTGICFWIILSLYHTFQPIIFVQSFSLICNTKSQYGLTLIDFFVGNTLLINPSFLCEFLFWSSILGKFTSAKSHK